MEGKASINKYERLAPILTDKCLRTHSKVYHLSHRIENCISEDKVCTVDFQKVLKPIKMASNISRNVKNYILDIRKRYNNKNAASGFRQRESDQDRLCEREIRNLQLQTKQLSEDRKELMNEIQMYRSLSVPLDPLPELYDPVPEPRDPVENDSDQDIDVTTIRSRSYNGESFSY